MLFTDVYRRKPKQTGRTKYVYQFDLHDNVLAKWNNEDGWFKAQIYARRMGKYSVYFPEDGQVLKSVEEKNLKEADPKDRRNKMNRTHFVGLEFNHTKYVKGKTPEQTGYYKVVGLATGKNCNKYKCNRLDRKDIWDTKEIFFDMGHVQRILLPECFPMLGRG